MNTVPGRPDPSGRLLLIGNSFDLMHGMSTRWEEFQKWWLGNIKSQKRALFKF
ncbi:Uncharacterised protein [Arcanobacterium haemolyticum]|uniref:Uncharacterized protein n=1 Tax=Arcanobacterium haemolyticum (strain ATCC 9345 / DSM 20595 / CCM 5947 / CCUG 17215 / LMG 16163 / NBRC 15585 / NCTC 8452 / 11018) TaxID=644284 RepID=D7BPR3_ARCHD|nr:hypothetical protein Arch_1202 [Arcanobacterium haemolyticum DSM 20595]SPT75565.1 Uncharacterised protein [Arcanobacterium haemolyticum]SQH28337.1 Uncharacterised protein [Arcanobacterium haemolyticum]